MLSGRNESYWSSCFPEISIFQKSFNLYISIHEIKIKLIIAVGQRRIAVKHRRKWTTRPSNYTVEVKMFKIILNRAKAWTIWKKAFHYRSAAHHSTPVFILYSSNCCSVSSEDWLHTQKGKFLLLWLFWFIMKWNYCQLTRFACAHVSVWVHSLYI